jgi:uncharacterized protein (DUF362 family)
MNLNNPKANLSRRDFCIRLAKAGGIASVAGVLGYHYYDPVGPLQSENSRSQVRLADFSIPGLAPKMGIVHGADRTKTIALALKAIGGIEQFVKPGDRVLLKVNAAFATPPALSATTNPQLVSELARMCVKAGAASVVVTDNPINDPASCFALSGISRAARDGGARVLVPETVFFRPFTLPAGSLLRDWPILFEPFKSVNKIIGVAPAKDHHRSGASMTMKNWYGLLGGRRNIFHQDIHNIIKELAMMVNPTLVVLDATTAMMSNGPTGGSLSDLKPVNTMVVGTDQVAVDAFGATLLEKKISDLTFIAKAAALGLGTADWRSLRPEIVNAES